MRQRDVRIIIATILYMVGYSLMWLFTIQKTYYDTGSLFQEIYIVLAVLAFIAGSFLVRNERTLSIQIGTISTLLFLILGMAVIQDFSNFKTAIVCRYALIIILIGLLLISIISLGALCTKVNGGMCWFAKVFLWIKQNYCFFLLIILVSIIFIINYGTLPLWDSLHTYWHGEVNSTHEIFNIDHTGVATVCRFFYIILNVLMSKIFHNVLLGESVLQFLMMIGGICACYGIINFLFRDNQRKLNTLLVGIYAFSPFVLGMSGNNIWDYWTFTLLPIIIFFYLKRKYVFHFFFAIILLFTKETGIVSYAGFCVGVVIMDYINERSISNIIRKTRYWIMLYFGIECLFVYLFTTGFQGITGGFSNGHLGLANSYENDVLTSFVASRIPMIKNWFILNFNWVLEVGSICGMIFAFLRRRNILGVVLPILTSDVFMMFFYFAFDTNKHSRYLNTHIPCLNLLFIISVGLISISYVKYIISVITILLMVIQNYITFDPLTLLTYDRYVVGDQKIICTCEKEEFMSDSIVYNRQYKYYDKALNMAMEMPVMEKALICLPYNERWFFFASTFYGEHDKIETGYWDPNRHARTIKSFIDMGEMTGWVDNSENVDVYGSEKYLQYRGMLLGEDDNIAEATEGEEAYYFCNPSYGMEVYNRLKHDGVILDEQIISYRGWDIYRVKFSYSN